MNALKDELSTEERACLLRAARRQLKVLNAELHRLESLPLRYAEGPIGACMQERDCLAASITWLWRQATK